MKEKFEHRLEQTVGPERVLREEPMRLHTTFRIGGPAQYMVSPRTKEEVQEVVRLCQQPNGFTFSYDLEAPLEEKLEAIVTKIYHGDGVDLSPNAKKQAAQLKKLGFGGLPVCMAKTQYSLSDDPAKLGRPEGFTLQVSEVRLSAGAGFVVVQTGSIMTMPVLPKKPSAQLIDIDGEGAISGLF